MMLPAGQPDAKMLLNPVFVIVLVCKWAGMTVKFLVSAVRRPC